MSRKSRDYAVRLKTFEEKHQMSIEEFKKRFETGLLGDEEGSIPTTWNCKE